MFLDFKLTPRKTLIRELNGVGNGPKTSVFMVDKTKEFSKAGISYSRTHDTEGAYGSGEFINIHCVFPNFEADVNAPDSYNFACTDLYLKYILEAGTKVYYRLGETIENSSAIVSRYIYPPKDMKKWAQICEHIIMHYNEGWADGYHMGIEYWEIWNEPDNWHCWAGTSEQYYELYSITANHLKNRFPDIKIGGYGATGFYTAVRPDYTHGAFDDWFENLVPFAKGFFKYITAPETKAPLDFFSWHYYSNDLSDIAVMQTFVRSMLDRYGFENAESHLNEWNYNSLTTGGDTTGEFRKSMKCAAFVAAMFCAMHDAGVDKAMYYDAEVRRTSYCGLFESGNPIPMKPYYSFLAYKFLIDAKYEAGTMIDHENDIYGLAAVDDEVRGSVMFVNTGCNSKRICIDLSDLKSSADAYIYLLNREKNLECVQKMTVGNVLEIECEPDTVTVVNFS